MDTGEGDNPKKASSDSSGYTKKLAEAANVDWTTLAKTIENTYNVQVKLNEAFGQGQERLSETYKAVSDAAPRIARLGGSLTDTGKTIIGISEASRRNVIANTEDVEKLYAATQVIEGSAESLANAFLDVGVGIGQIGKQLEGSVNYIRSIGGNTRTIMKTVTDNMGELNRYQFEGGVKGLTKMAAQASMLRFDMSNTFALAEKVLDPEGAIEVAAAFQRLGVSAGNLTDPFQLLNQSLTDPSGLQNSLAEVSKQFTYFDEETKTFKINPQGVLTLREMEKGANLAQGSLSKMGLAAAELDKRMSEVNMAGLNVSEEDKQYLANISTMGESGKYEVELKDNVKKELSSLNQDEFDELIKEQKDGDKTLEEIANLQLGIDEDILYNVEAMNSALSQGLTSAKQIRQGIAGAQKVTKTTLGNASDSFKAKDLRTITEKFLDVIGDFSKEVIDGNKPLSTSITTSVDKLGVIYEKSREDLLNGIKSLIEKTSKEINNTAPNGTNSKNTQEEIDKITGNKSSSSVPLTSSNNVNSVVLQNGNNVNTNPQVSNSKVDVSGKIEFDFKGVPTGISTEEVKKLMDSTLNSVAFQDYMGRLASPKDLKEPVSKIYNA